jgi:hypothetical protein
MEGFSLGVILACWAAAAPPAGQFPIQLACLYARDAEATGHWPLAENLHVLTARLDEDRVEAATHQVNACLARTRWRGSEPVADQVRGWDTSGLPPRFALAKVILLGQQDTALRMPPELVR